MRFEVSLLTREGFCSSPSTNLVMTERGEGRTAGQSGRCGWVRRSSRGCVCVRIFLRGGWQSIQKLDMVSLVYRKSASSVGTLAGFLVDGLLEQHLLVGFTRNLNERLPSYSLGLSCVILFEFLPVFDRFQQVDTHLVGDDAGSSAEVRLSHAEFRTVLGAAAAAEFHYFLVGDVTAFWGESWLLLLGVEFESGVEPRPLGSVLLGRQGLVEAVPLVFLVPVRVGLHFVEVSQVICQQGRLVWLGCPTVGLVDVGKYGKSGSLGRLGAFDGLWRGWRDEILGIIQIRVAGEVVHLNVSLFQIDRQGQLPDAQKRHDALSSASHALDHRGQHRFPPSFPVITV